MDMFNKAKAALGSSSGSKPAHNTNNGGQQQDYLDKGLAAAQKHFGFKSNAGTNEKITDAGRGFYEKQTGKKVNSKFSN